MNDEVSTTFGLEVGKSTYRARRFIQAIGLTTSGNVYLRIGEQGDNDVTRVAHIALTPEEVGSLISTLATFQAQSGAVRKVQSSLDIENLFKSTNQQ